MRIRAPGAASTAVVRMYAASFLQVSSLHCDRSWLGRRSRYLHVLLYRCRRLGTLQCLAAGKGEGRRLLREEAR